MLHQANGFGALRKPDFCRSTGQRFATLNIGNPALPCINLAAEIADGDSLSPVAPYRTVNIGNSNKVSLARFVEAVEQATGVIAQKNLLPMQKGDVPATWANAELLQRLTGYRPDTDVREGVARFVDWYRDYYGK